MVGQTEDESSEESPQGVRKPVVGIVSGAVFEKGLMVFVNHPDSREDQGDNQEESLPGRVASRVKGGRKESGSAEEIAKVENLIKMGNLEEEEGPGRMELVSMREEVENNEPHTKGGRPQFAFRF